MARLLVLLALIATLALPAAANGAPDANRSPLLQYLPDDNTEMQYLVVSFPAGSLFDPPGQEGLASVTAAFIESRVERRLQEALTGAELFVLLDRERVTYFLKGHRDRFGEAQAVLLEELALPSVDGDDLESARGRARNRVENLLQSPERLSRLLLEEALFRGGEYGRPLYGRRRSLDKVQPRDLSAFHWSHYGRVGAELAVGGYQAEALLPGIAQALESLPTSPPEGLLQIEQRRPSDSRNRVLLVRQQVPTTAVALGFAVDFNRSDPDYYTLLPANSWLGQHRYMHGALFRGLREVRGLNYGDYSYLEKFAEGRQDKMPWPRVPRRWQYFSIWIRNLADENAVFATRYSIYQLRELIAEGLSEEELALNRDFVVNNSKLWAFDPLQKLGFMLDDRFYGTGPYLEEIERRTSQVTPEMLRQALQRQMAGRPLRIVMVTSDPETMKKRLLGEVDAHPKYRTRIPAAEQAVDERVLQVDLGLSPEDIEIVDAEDLL
jgi:zinc protease